MNPGALDVMNNRGEVRVLEVQWKSRHFIVTEQPSKVVQVLFVVVVPHYRLTFQLNEELS